LERVKRLDVTLTTRSVAVNYWTGTSPTPSSLGFALPSGLSGAIDIEVARIGGQIVLFAGTTQIGTFADPGLFSSGQVLFGFNVAPQDTFTLIGLTAAVPSGSTTRLDAPFLQKAARSGIALRDIADKSGFLVGGEVDTRYLSEEYAYRASSGPRIQSSRRRRRHEVQYNRNSAPSIRFLRG